MDKEKALKNQGSEFREGIMCLWGVKRDSGIEFLKICAVILIIISHVVQTVGTPNSYVPFQDYVVSLDTATQNVQRLTMTMLRYSGVLGNSIFFSCSAWFLLDSERSNKRKILKIILDI